MQWQQMIHHDCHTAWNKLCSSNSLCLLLLCTWCWRQMCLYGNCFHVTNSEVMRRCSDDANCSCWESWRWKPCAQFRISSHVLFWISHVCSHLMLWWWFLHLETSFFFSNPISASPFSCFWFKVVFSSPCQNRRQRPKVFPAKQQCHLQPVNPLFPSNISLVAISFCFCIWPNSWPQMLFKMPGTWNLARYLKILQST